MAVTVSQIRYTEDEASPILTTDGFVSINTSSHLQVVAGAEVVDLFGSGFAFDRLGNPVGGTLNRVEYRFFNQLQYSVSELNASVVTLYSFADDATPVRFNEYLYGGNDQFYLSPFDDIAFGHAGDDLLQGGPGNDRLVGDSGNDTLVGQGNNDTLEGSAGSDVLRGGAGDDTFLLDPSDVYEELAGEGVDTVLAAFSLTLGANVERLVFSGSDALTGIGNELDNVLTGNAGVNSLDGGAGNDTLIGGEGVDTLVGGTGNDSYVWDGIDTIVELAGEGTDELQVAQSYTLPAVFENLTLLGSADLTGTGNAADNVITGNGGNNTLDGGAGNDTLSGGLGTDTFIVDSSQDVVTDVPSWQSFGRDIVLASASFSLAGTEIEDLTLTGNAAINATGNAYANQLVGNDAANVLDGGGQTDYDTLRGGGGDDVYVVAAGWDQVIELEDGGIDTARMYGTQVLLPANVENLELLDGSSAYGNTLANRITGNALDNVFFASDASADTVLGGAGNDTYYVDPLDTVIELANEGVDTLDSPIGMSLSALPDIENLIVHADHGLLVGNDRDNQLTGGDSLDGGAGNDTLDGGFGDNTLAGGAGDDRYEFGIDGAANNTVLEALGEGTDTLRSARFSEQLPDNVEHLILSGYWYGAHRYGTGNALANHLSSETFNGLPSSYEFSGGEGDDTLIGAAIDDTLDGGAGNDSLVGGTGNDVYVLDAPGDVIVELPGAGIDTVVSAFGFSLADGMGANVENLRLTGAADGDATGNASDNLIAGNAGDNRLDGRAGHDTVSYADASAAVSVSLALTSTQDTGGAGRDTVIGFETLVGSAFDDALSGDDGDNRLDGGAGIDTLAGGGGDDTYVVDSAADQIVEAADAGNDTVLSAVSYALSDDTNVENLGLAEAGFSINAHGNSRDNILSGNGFTNVLDGGPGIDTVSYARALGAVQVNLGLDTEQYTYSEGFDTLLNIENLTGSPFGDTLIGSAGDNVIDGGDGIDVVLYSMANAGVRASLDGTAQDTGVAGVDTLVRVEQLVGSAFDDALGGSATADTIRGGSGSDMLQGGAGDDALFGDDGNDVFFGGDGADQLWGGAGADVLASEGDADRVVGNGGNDYLYTGAGDDVAMGDEETVGYSGPDDGIDVFVLGAGNDSAYGAGGQDYFYGGDGNDVLQGGDGVDVIIGESGNDTAFGDNGSYYVYAAGAGDGGDYFYLGEGDDLGYGEGGNDIFVLDVGNDTAVGGVGQDYFYMGAGNDSMDGGAGVDVMLGELGDDTFNGGTDVDYAFLGPGGAGDNDLVIVDRFASGPQVVFGFEPGGTNDVINLRNSGWYSFAQVQAAISDYTAAGNFMIITLDDDTNLWLIGVQPAQLTASDFLFT